MSYRTQEILRMIIPGLYLIAMLLIIFLAGGGWNEIDSNDQLTIIDVLKGASNVVVLLLPFLGFVAGYVIECIMAFGERLLYVVGVRRPSKVVLMNSKIYVVSNLENIKKELAIDGTITNVKAGNALQKAKQTIERQKVEMFHDTSIMARNIMGSQFLLVVFTAFYSGLFSMEFWGMTVMLLILGIYWYHRNCIYAKYVLSEYSKTLKAVEPKNV
jgi:hypothetical protein